MAEQTPSNPSPASDPLADVVDFKRDLPGRYPAVFKKPNTAEWLLRGRDRNGLAPYVRFVGRTAYITLSDFASWFRTRTEAPAGSEARRAAARVNVAAARAAKASPAPERA